MTTALPPASYTASSPLGCMTAISRIVRSRFVLWVLLLVSALGGIGWITQLRHNSLVESYTTVCHKYSKLQKWPDLRLAADQLISLDPISADGWLFRAEAEEGQQDWVQLVHCLGQVPVSDRRIVPSLLKKLQVQFEKLNRPFDSVRTSDELLLVDERVLLAHKQGVFVCAMTLQRPEMVRRIRNAIRFGRESPESYVFLASASWLVNSSAYKHATSWLLADPDSEVLQVAQALPVYNSEAKTDLEHADRFEHVLPAEVLFQRFPGNPELAAYFLEQAISDGSVDRVSTLLAGVPVDRQTGDARFLRARAWLYDISGELEKAESALQEGVAVDCYWWQLHHHLHDILRRLNRPAQAAAALEKYKLAVDLAVTVRGLKRYEQSFEDPRFPQLMFKLAKLCDDTEVVNALQLRLGTN